MDQYSFALLEECFLLPEEPIGSIQVHAKSIVPKIGHFEFKGKSYGLKRRLTKSLYTAEWEILIKALKDLREQRGWTQQDVAEKLGRPRSLVAKIEIGERKLDVCQFIDYMQILEADPVAVMKQILKAIQDS